MSEDVGTLVDRRVLDGCLQFLYLFFLCIGSVLHLALYLLGALAQGVVAEFLCFWIYRLDFFYQRLDELHVARRLIAEQGA